MQESKSFWQEQQAFTDKKGLKKIHSTNLYKENIVLCVVYIEEETFLKSRIFLLRLFLHWCLKNPACLLLRCHPTVIMNKAVVWKNCHLLEPRWLPRELHKQGSAGKHLA